MTPSAAVKIEINTRLAMNCYDYLITVKQDGVLIDTAVATPRTVIKTRNRLNARWSDQANGVTATPIPEAFLHR